FDELLHAVLKRSEKWRSGFVGRARDFSSSGEHGAAETSVSALHLGEAGEDGTDAEAGGFAAVDAGEQRVGEAVDHFGAVVALDQRGYAFIRFGGARGME